MEPSNLPSPLTSTSIRAKKPLNKGLLFTLASVLLIGFGALGYWIYVDNFVEKEPCDCDQALTTEYSNNESTDTQEQITTETTDSTFTVNAQDPGLGDYFKYLTFQIQYNSEYFVTSDNEITNYQSQGGSAAPRLVLSTITQPLGDITYRDLLTQEAGKCITIWSTRGAEGIEDWYYYNGIEDPTVISEEQVTGDVYTFAKKIISSASKSQNFVVAYLSLDEDVSYFFETNNTLTESDLDFVMNHFDIRGDLEQ